MALPSTNTLPLDGGRMPARMDSSVLLPQPDWPIRLMNSPGLTERLMFCSACVSPCWVK
ncbi:hypothetical protein D3C72_2429440 [compost metagenome]